MPYRRRNRMNRKKRTYRRKNIRRRYRKKASTLTIRTPSLLPDRLFVKLKYTQSGQWDPVVASPNVTQQWTGNSLFDPDFTGTGHQPLGFDQYAAFYSYYRVHASLLVVQLMSTAAANGSYLKFYLTPTLTSVIPGNVDTGTEQPYAKRRFLAANTANNIVTLKNKMYTKKLFGYKTINQETDFAAAVTASPVNLWYWTLSSSTVGGANTSGVYYDATIYYYAEFFERKQLTSS